MNRGRRPGRRFDPVRRAAVEVLAQWIQGKRHVEDHIDALERSDAVAAWNLPDRRRLREIVFGCARLRGRYDHLANALNDGTKSPPPALRALLWAGMHELIEMRSPDHAVVHEYVEGARALRMGWATGWVNAVLRRVVREGHAGFFPDPAEDPLGYAATWGSHPRWLVEAWSERLGPSETLELCEAGNRRPSLHLRSAPGRRDALAGELAAREWESKPIDLLPDALEVITRVPPAVILEVVEEPCAVQDAAAQLVAPVLAAAVESRARVLDLCAAPGGKTGHLAQLLGPRGRVTAADLDARRLRAVESTVARLGVADRVETVVADGAAGGFADAGFDGVLVDAPCTGTGVLARRHDARWNRRPEDLSELPRLQAALLEAAIDATRPGGTIVYATCSLEAEENDEVVDSVLARRHDVAEIGVDDAAPSAFVRDGRLQTWPHRHGLDGAFAVRLRRLQGDAP